MIGNGHGAVAPLGRALDQGGGRRHGVHVAHLGMHMQLDALFLRVVHAHGQRDARDVADHYDCFMREIIVLAVAAHQHAHAFLDLSDHVVHSRFFFGRNGWRRFLFLLARIARAVVQKGLAFDGACKVGHGKRKQNGFAARYFACFDRKHLAPDHDQPCILRNFIDRHGRIGDSAALDAVGLGLFFGGRRFLLCLAHFFRALHRELFFIVSLVPLDLKQRLRVAAHADAHVCFQPEHVVNRFFEQFLRSGAGHVLHGEIIRHVQRHAPAHIFPAHHAFPRGQRGKLAV